MVGLDEIQIYKHIRRIKNSFINCLRVEKLFLIPELLLNFFAGHFVFFTVQDIIINVIENLKHRVLQSLFFLLINLQVPPTILGGIQIIIFRGC